MYFILINGHFNLIDSSPSILRASLSCILAIIATLFYNLAVKRLHLLALVGTLCLAINPLYLQSLGFQLSFLASFIILFFWPYIKKKTASSSFMLSLTVQFCLWPLLILYFSNINLIAIPANVMLSPLVETLTVGYFVFIALKTSNIALLADFVGSLIRFVSNIFFIFLNLFEKIPGKSITINQAKYSIIFALLFIELIFVYLIFHDRYCINKKNKYRTFSKWSNWSKR